MAFNKFMHPRNRYRKEKPCFLKLALKYPDFRAHITQDDTGKAILDFKNADALRALTTCLLKEDFDLAVDLPSNRLVPTLPLRLNYIHWIEDIIGTDQEKWGIDIGTGSSCVYPLLATKLNQWHFLATEADQENAFHAQKNVNSNNLKDFIRVKPVSTEDVLLGPLEDLPTGCPDKFDFCMCNPPFFADHMEAQAVTTSRSVDRPEPNSMSTASPEECISAGGEVGFIRQMIEESTVLRDRVRVYTSMVGKKASLTKLKEELRHQKVTKFSTTEFCQGKTMRWGIAWTYDSKVTFPRSEFEARKEKPPLQYIIPKGAGAVDYEVHAVSSFLKDLLVSIKVHVFQGKKAKSYTSLTLTAAENSWCHQRRRRRQQQQQQQRLLQEGIAAGTAEPVAEKETETNVVGEDNPQDSVEQQDEKSICGKKRSNEDLVGSNTETNKRSKLNHEDNRIDGDTSPLETKHNVEKLNSDSQTDLKNDSAQQENKINTDMSPKDFILKCVLRLKLVNEKVNMELEWLEGDKRELMHQLFTFLKNKLSPPQLK